VDGDRPATEGDQPQTKEPPRRVWQVLKRSAFNEDGSLWFPSRLTESWLADQKAELKPYLFASQYLNEYISSEDRRFRPEWIRYKPFYLEYVEGRIHLVEEFDRDYQFHHIRPVNVFTAVDPAISDRKYADYTGISTVAVDQHLNYYVLESRRVRGGVDAVIPEILAEIRIWSSGLLIIETNAFQKAYKKWLELKFEEERVAIAIKEVKSGVGTGKDARIENMTTPFANLKVWIRSGIAPYLEHELLNWRPKQDSGHDDLIDSLAFAFENSFPTTLGQLVPNDSNWHDMDPKERQKLRARKDALASQMERQSDRSGASRQTNFSTGWDAPPKAVPTEKTKEAGEKFWEAWKKSEEEYDKAARKPAGPKGQSGPSER
jgi:hypothetical protein